jgi:hypothetical protein
LHTLTIECQMMARACGKTNVHSLEPEDLRRSPRKHPPWHRCRLPVPNTLSAGPT